LNQSLLTRTLFESWITESMCYCNKRR